MKKSFYKLILLVALIISAPNCLWAKPPKGLSIKNISVSELEKLYHQYGYDEYVKRPQKTIPRIYLEKFPHDFNQIQEQEQRNILFIKILTPLVMRVNEEILQERAEIEEIQTKLRKNRELNQKDTQKLEDFAVKYDIFTRFEGYRRHQVQIEKLLKKVDQIYPSILISISAVETDWGNSRIIRDGNSLYKELVWHSEEGLTPEGETEDETYKIKTFPNLYESIKSYALKFNSNVSFDHARTLRANQRETKMAPSGKSMSHSLLLQSPLSGYLGLIDYIIVFYKLMFIDLFELENHSPKKLIVVGNNKK